MGRRLQGKDTETGELRPPSEADIREEARRYFEGLGGSLETTPEKDERVYKALVEALQERKQPVSIAEVSRRAGVKDSFARVSMERMEAQGRLGRVDGFFFPRER